MRQLKLVSYSLLPHLKNRCDPYRNSFAVLLAVHLLFGVLICFFSGCSQSQEPSKGKPGTQLIISTQGNGVELSATLPPGPYFLREMLGVDLSLTNHTQSPIYAGPPFADNPCGYYSGIVITGGNEPKYKLPVELGHGCPGNFSNVALQSGKSITIHTYEPLLSSGSLTLTGQVRFYKPTTGASGDANRSLDDPLQGNWPTTQIQVSSIVPKDRQILLKQENNAVNVSGPQSAQLGLVYAYKLACGSIAAGELTETGNYSWDKSMGSSVHPPQDSYCAGKKMTWTYVFASSGYALASGTFQSS